MLNMPRFLNASHHVALLALSLIPAAATLRAQGSGLPAAPPLRSRVELKLGSRDVIRGALAGRVDDDIVLVRGESDSVHVAMSNVITAWRFEGTGRKGWSAVGAGAAVGAGVGALIIGLASADHSSPEHGFGVALAVEGAGALTVTGAVLGGLIGLLPEDHWVEFDPATITVTTGAGER